MLYIKTLLNIKYVIFITTKRMKWEYSSRARRTYNKGGRIIETVEDCIVLILVCLFSLAIKFKSRSSDYHTYAWINNIISFQADISGWNGYAFFSSSSYSLQFLG